MNYVLCSLAQLTEVFAPKQMFLFVSSSQTITNVLPVSRILAHSPRRSLVVPRSGILLTRTEWFHSSGLSGSPGQWIGRWCLRSRSSAPLPFEGHTSVRSGRMER